MFRGIDSYAADPFGEELISLIRDWIISENNIMKRAGFSDKYLVFPENYEINRDNYADVLNELRIAFAYDIDILLSMLEKTCWLIIEKAQEGENNVSIPCPVKPGGIFALRTSH